MSGEHPIPLKKLLMQVNKSIFVIQNDDGLHFVTKDNDFFINAFKENTLHRIKAFVPAVRLENLGDEKFKKRHSLKYPYIAGAMANGITSATMVKTMAENGMIGFLGAGGLSLEKIEKNIIELTNTLKDKPFGFNLIHSLGDPAHEMATVDLYLKYKIKLISAAAFMRMTPALVYYRIKGIYKNDKGHIVTPNHIIAKVSRIEIARQFFSPPPEKLVNILLEKDLITNQEAKLSQYIPMAQDLTAEADSGGHTDNRPALALLPTMMALKNEFMETYNYKEPLCVGLAGGIATPQSAAAAFSMGAAYILTGSINQSCVEAGICEDVKKMLCQAEQADVTMAPAADMFEIGAKVQVLKRGTMFPVRADKLYKFYKSHNSFDEIDEKSKQEIQDKFLQATFEEAWDSTKDFFHKTGNIKEIKRAQNDPKHKMALVFRSYLGLSSKWAIQGIPQRKMDYQIWCGPAIGAFNQWVKGSFLEAHENRKTDEIALNLMFGACICIRASILRTQGIELPMDASLFKPLGKKEISTFL
ncbi:MAG: PfaD family polyunsaturated fatty acid/polyketide biosynthesis protein [Desulfobacula sp.]|uniref:PfaD family polyunsaturated fatty acid/polyketide biosynthesis protein n=1 Tax=Desulfobacula sp. TaxID=2593537 RepID=UPI0025BF8781|nr:PfaD family polyunsaturated fatty acid/polyketide biosynthesis protein [Desulfobacula sp.]MCD4722212.1 PfaD family polyunsaturated fatty acid/polyketide biosynthesis protein [Desulfobacula sp.]